MNERVFISPSERYRACAEACRREAQTFLRQRKLGCFSLPPTMSVGPRRQRRSNRNPAGVSVIRATVTKTSYSGRVSALQSTAGRSSPTRHDPPQPRRSFPGDRGFLSGDEDGGRCALCHSVRRLPASS